MDPLAATVGSSMDQNVSRAMTQRRAVRLRPSALSKARLRLDLISHGCLPSPAPAVSTIRAINKGSLGEVVGERD